MRLPLWIAILDRVEPSTKSAGLRPPEPHPCSQSLDPELAALVASLGSRVLAVERVGRLVSPTSSRAAFRVSLADGREFKARRVESVKRCEVLVRIWPLIENLPFSIGLRHRGASMLERWIPGQALTPDRVTSARLEEAGDLLGRLHRLRLPTDLVSTHTPTPRRLFTKVERSLGSLVKLGLLTSDEIARLLDEAREHLPQQLHAGLIHHDFCADNLVVSDRDRLWAIDNEDMRIGALDADLARVFLRWPLSASDRLTFLAGYERHRPAERYRIHAAFWSIWALAGAAEFRANRGLPAEAQLTMLRT